MTMTRRFDNYIGGEWVAGAATSPNINPSDLVRRHRRVRAGRCGAGRCRGAPRRSAAFPAWSAARRRRASTCSTRSAARSWRASDEIGTAAVARGRQDHARRHRRSHARAARSSSSSPARRCASAGELLPSVRPGRRRRDHARADRRGRPDHAVELSDRDSRRGRSRRRWPSATASCFKPADLVPGCAWALAEIISRAGLPPGRVQPRDGPRQRGRRGAGRITPASNAISFTGSVGDRARASSRAAPARCAKVQLEMGGKNPLVVLDDADLGVAVELRVQSALLLDRPALHRLEPR